MSMNRFLVSSCSLMLLSVGCASTPSSTANSPSPSPQTTASIAAATESQPALQQAIADYVKQQNAPLDTDHRYFADLIDLNGDGIQDGVVVFSSSYW